jgi:selenocysteine lyase/cysteine desulfurase
LVSITGASNVTGEVTPLTAITELAHRHGTRIAIDAAQLAPHRRIDMKALEVDFVAMSGHKMYAPYGAGVLIGPSDWLDSAEPYLRGGGAVTDVTSTRATWVTGSARHEAGTPNFLGAAALAAACRALSALPDNDLMEHESALHDRLLDGLRRLGIEPIRMWRDVEDVLGVVTFAMPDRDCDAVARHLAATQGIGLRAGRFCAHPLFRRLGKTDAIRASMGVGSQMADVDRLLDALADLEQDKSTTEAIDVDWAPMPTLLGVPELASRVRASAIGQACAVPTTGVLR